MTTQRKVLYCNSNPPSSSSSSSTSSLSFSPSTSHQPRRRRRHRRRHRRHHNHHHHHHHHHEQHQHQQHQHHNHHFLLHHQLIIHRTIAVFLPSCLSFLHCFIQSNNLMYDSCATLNLQQNELLTWILGYPQNQPVKGDSLHTHKNEHAPRKFQKESSLLLFQGYVSFRQSIAFYFLKRQTGFDISNWE